MIVALLGKSGAGKTFIAQAMENYVKDSFVIDGDELRAETSNMDIGVDGRIANMELGYSRARRLADLGFTVFVAMQAPFKEIREKYLDENDIQIIVENHGKNPKDEMGYNENFFPDYSGVKHKVILQEFTPESFYDNFFKKVLVPARFQGFHKGHKVVLEEAKRISPNITIGLRVDEGDVISLEDSKRILESRGYKVIETPGINEDWTEFANQFDVYVQGNPMVIEKFKNSRCKLHFVPRYGSVSGTSIRKAVKEGKTPTQHIDEDVLEVVKKYVES